MEFLRLQWRAQRVAGLKLTRFMTRELNSPAVFCHKPSHFLSLFDTSSIPHTRFSELAIRQTPTSEFGAQTTPGVTSKNRAFTGAPARLLESNGAIAQLVERRVRNAKVRGSIPLSSTNNSTKISQAHLHDLGFSLFRITALRNIALSVKGIHAKR